VNRPYLTEMTQSTRTHLDQLEGNAEFIEVLVDALLEVCETRDPKNLSKKARASEIGNFTGKDAPYEAPEDPEIVVHTDRQTVDE
jgi:adenylylsulfate kinase